MSLTNFNTQVLEDFFLNITLDTWQYRRIALSFEPSYTAAASEQSQWAGWTISSRQG